MPKTTPKDEEEIRNTENEDRFYRLHLARENITVSTDPMLIKLSAFSKAANELRAEWDALHDDGNHPIITAGAYPFGEQFSEVSDAIAVWTENSIEHAKAAMEEVGHAEVS